MPTAKPATTLPDNLTAEQVIALIFKDPSVKYGLEEFADIGKKPHEVLEIFAQTVAAGRAQGEVRYCVKCLKRG
jgi:hypothetical protein